MSNHYHILIETRLPNLSLGMRQLNGLYTTGFNRQHRRTGHVFQGRFNAIVVEREAYLTELNRYIALNPIKAGMVKRIEAWKWSSYPAFTGAVERPTFLTTAWILGQFGKDERTAGPS